MRALNSQPPYQPAVSHSARDGQQASGLRQLSLEALMERYVDGDVAAFNAMYARLAPRLLGYLLSLTRCRDCAEDLLQTTFAKVHRARSSYLRGAPVQPWLRAIARRAFVDEQRGQRVRREQLSNSGTLPEVAARSALSKIELPHELDRALAELPTASREAILLTKYFGYSGDEAAAALGTTRGAIKLRVHRGNQQLREALGVAA
jgi:RNA polymerase sigma-70 factor (ECF subfamily)